jgi:hypothetical protein
MKLKSEARKSDAPRAKPFARFSQWTAKHPVLAIVLVSLIAIAINCYPVIFLGKSFVAPAYGVPMLYERYPTLPAMDRDEPVVAHGSDTAATLIWGVPVGFIESRALFDHGELPLWNRYSHAGDTLIGQAVSMFGDPLQWIVILGRGSSLAWDIKFLVDKFLFCVGFGLLIRRLMASVPLALIFSVLAAYCGAFYYIFDHPAFFVFSYAPWILLSAIEMLDLRSPHYLRWALVWLVVCFGSFNGGHVELAILLIGGFNCAALAFALLSNRGIFAAAKICIRIMAGTILFLALTSPVWVAFLGALPGTFTIHEGIHVMQFPFADLLGIFDDVFFRLPAREGPFSAPAPGSSFLIMVGCIYAFVSWRMLKRECFFWVNTAAIVLWGGLVFGWIPGAVIAAIPMLNREAHTHTDLSYLLVIHLTIQCAYGFRCLAREESLRNAGTKLLWTAFSVAALTLLFFYGTEHAEMPWNYFFLVAIGAIAAPLLYAILKSRSSLSFPGVIALAVLAFVPNFRFAFYTFGDKHLVMVPGKRVAFDAPSPAIDWIKSDKSSPFRVTGAELNLFGDYSAVYGLENISSCAPLSNGEFVRLLRATPGILGQMDWVMQLTNVVAAHPLLNLLNVKYILTPPAVEVQEGLGYRLALRSDLGVLENLEVWPRAFFCDKIIPLSSTEEFIGYLYAKGGKPFVAMTPAEISKQSALAQMEGANSTFTPATNYVLLPNSTAFDVHAASPGVACLTETEARDFTALVDGQIKPVLTVNRAFKGIYLDRPGDHHIEFIYRPHHWLLACRVFCAAAVCVALIAFLAFFGGRFKKSEIASESDIPSP